MNKKFLTFGLMGLFVMAFAAAALVPYLSNQVTTDIDVKSPLLLEADLSELNGNIINVRDFNLTNNADLPVSAIVELSVSGDSFVTEDFGAEFETFLIGLEMSEASCDAGYGDLFEDRYCYWDASYDRSFTGIVGEVYYAQMGDRDSPQPIEAGATLNGKLKLRFAHNVEGLYTLDVRAMVPELSNDLDLE